MGTALRLALGAVGRMWRTGTVCRRLEALVRTLSGRCSDPSLRASRPRSGRTPIRLSTQAAAELVSVPCSRLPGRDRLRGSHWADAGQSRVGSRGCLSLPGLDVLLLRTCQTRRPGQAPPHRTSWRPSSATSTSEPSTSVVSESARCISHLRCEVDRGQLPDGRRASRPYRR